jgi:hypothetical protein
LPEELPVNNRELPAAQKLLLEAIERSIEEIRQGGKVLRAHKPIPFRFYRQRPCERSDEDPQKGLLIQTSRSLWADLAIEDDKILEVVKRYLDVCSKKFAIWGNSRRILLLEPHGSFVSSVLSDAPWAELVHGEVDEIWMGSFDSDPSVGMSWFDKWYFDKLYPREDESGSLEEASRTLAQE